jgi:hypothetical protein
MSPKSKRVLSLVAVLALMLCTQAAQACAVCAGRSDSDLAKGMNWGLFTLLGVVVFVLAGIASFFVFLIKKSAAAASMTAQPLPQSTQQI